jgi:hypothetical protein
MKTYMVARGDDLLNPIFQLASKEDITTRIDKEIEGAVKVVKYTGQYESGDEDKIRAAFWHLAEKNKCADGSYIMGYFFLKLGLSERDLRRLVIGVCGEKGLDTYGRYKVQTGKVFGSVEEVIVKSASAHQREQLYEEKRIAAGFVPFNAKETTYDQILFANGEDKLPYDDLTNDEYEIVGMYDDTQVAFALRVKYMYGFEIFERETYNYLWLHRVLNMNCDVMDKMIPLNIGSARYGSHIESGSDIGVFDVHTHNGCPGGGCGHGCATADAGVAFFDEMFL